MVRNFAVKAVHNEMYPATYNFRDDTDGAEPDGWTTNNGANCTTTIIASLDGHRKVLQLYDPNGATRAEIYISVTQGLNTTVEFWVRWDVNKAFFFDFYEGATVLGAIAGDNDRIFWYNGGWIELKVGAVNTWYHVKVIFNDAANTVDCYVDGILAAGGGEAYENNSTSGVDKINLQTDAGDSGYNFYIDAIGVSTDPNYNVGDNCFWRHYKESEADTFEEDDVGTQNASITWVDGVDDAGSWELVQEFNEHKKILRGIYESGLGGSDFAYHDFTSQSISGWTSLWAKASDAGEVSNNRIQLQDRGVNVKINIRIANDKWQYDSGGWNDTGLAAVDDTWYLVYIEWYADSTFDLWIDNVQYVDGAANANVIGAGVDGIILYSMDNDGYIYIDAPISSLDGDTRADNRTFDYNDPYTRKDITTEIINVFYQNKLHNWRTATLLSIEEYDANLMFFQIYDINSKLSMEAEIANRIQLLNNVRRYPLIDKNKDDLLSLNNQTFASDKIHDPTDSTSMLKTILPNVSEADGDLILVNADTKTDTYSPVLKNYPTLDFLRDLSDLGDSVVIIEPNGKCHLDDDLASGDSLDVDNETDRDLMTQPPKPNDIAGINYWEVRGMINPDTGERFEKIIDSSGTNKKRKWRITNNSFRTQTDVNNYATKLSTKIVAVKEITIKIQGFGTHNVGETFDYKYVDSVYNIPQANYYVISETMNFDKAKATIVLSEGLAELSKYASGYERPQNYNDAFASEIYETDINTISLAIFPDGGATQVGHLVQMNAANEVARGGFYVSDKIDPSRPITLYFVVSISALAGDGKINMTFSAVRVPCDCSSTGNPIALGAGHLSCEATKTTVVTHTISASDVYNNNDYTITAMLNDGAPADIYLRTLTIKYFVKRDV